MGDAVWPSRQQNVDRSSFVRCCRPQSHLGEGSEEGIMEERGEGWLTGHRFRGWNRSKFLRGAVFGAERAANTRPAGPRLDRGCAAAAAHLQGIGLRDLTE